MKKLIKLQINSEKVIKSEELITLKGGYGYNCYDCRNADNDNIGYFGGSGLNLQEAIWACNLYYPGSDYAYPCSC